MSHRWSVKRNRNLQPSATVTGKAVGKVARSDAADVEAALDAALAAKEASGRTSVVKRALTSTASPTE